MLKQFFRFLSWLLLAWTVALLLAWGLGRALTDRFYLTQFISWVPSVAYGLLAVLSLSFSWLLALMGRPYLPASFAPEEDQPIRILELPRAAQRSRRAVGVACAAMIAQSFFIEHHMFRALRPVPVVGEPVRMVFWNAATDFMEDFADRATSVQPAIIAIANPAAYCKWEVIRAAAGEGSDAQRYGRLAFFSPWRIMKWGGTSLEIEGAKTRYFGEKASVDRGEAMFVQVDATEKFGRPIVVWLMDLPSDPNLSRTVIAEQAMRTIRSFAGPVLERGRGGLDQRVDAPTGFPTPDVIVGDFNIPRGSASLDIIAGDLEHVYDQVGSGLEATWHREYPFIAIDHVFTGGVVGAAKYRSIDVGAGQHLLQVVDLVAR